MLFIEEYSTRVSTMPEPAELKGSYLRTAGVVCVSALCCYVVWGWQPEKQTPYVGRLNFNLPRCKRASEVRFLASSKQSSNLIFIRAGNDDAGT